MSPRSEAPMMPCRACLGAGRVTLPVELLNALALLRRGPLSAPELDRLRMSGKSPTACNNLLEALRGLGFATRLKVGRRWEYRLVPGSSK